MAKDGGGFNPLSLIAPGIAGAFDYAGGKAQADAMREAAQLQDRRTGEALADARQQRDYQQAQYANYLERLRPFTQYGLNAGNTLNNLLMRSPYSIGANRGRPPAPQVPPPIAPPRQQMPTVPPHPDIYQE